MKKFLRWVLAAVIVVVLVVLAWVVFPGPQIRQVWQVISTPALAGPQGPVGIQGPQGPVGPKGDTGPAMDPEALLSNLEFMAAMKQAPKSESAPASVSAAPLIATCVLDSFPESARFGVQLEVEKLVNTDWEFNPSMARRVNEDSTHPELKADADLSGCLMLVEGRKVLKEEHHIWILVPGDKLYLDADGIFRAKEFSAWAYPTNWNMEDFSTPKAPIAAEFVDAKRNNMVANGYDWPIFVHQSSSTMLEFKSGDKFGAVLPNNCNFTDPSRINVTGVYDSGNKTFDASIGGEGCWTVVKLDGAWQYWHGARDNVVFTTIEAWLLPANWSEKNTQDWVAKQN